MHCAIIWISRRQKYALLIFSYVSCAQFQQHITFNVKHRKRIDTPITAVRRCVYFSTIVMHVCNSSATIYYNLHARLMSHSGFCCFIFFSFGFVLVWFCSLVMTTFRLAKRIAEKKRQHPNSSNKINTY